MKHPNENVIATIITKHWTTEEVKLMGFYMLDITFNTSYVAPHYFNENFNIDEENAVFYGYYFYLNGERVLVGEQCKYHLESDSLFEITSLTFFKEDDVDIKYKAKFEKKSDAEITDVDFPSSLSSNPYTSCFDLVVPAESLTLNTNLLPQGESYDKVEIESRKGSQFLVNEEQITIGWTELCSLEEKVTDLRFLGVIDIDEVTDEETSVEEVPTEIHLHLYKKGV